MKNLISLLPILFLIFAVAFGFVFWQRESGPPSQDKTSYPFIINPGESAIKIATKLEKEGFIKSSLAFKAYVQLSGKQNKIQAGDYRLNKNLSLPTLVNEIISGPVALWVTLQEGLRHEEMGIKITNVLGVKEKQQSDFLAEFNKLSGPQEGFLFPDTYLLFKNANPGAIVAKLTSNFDKKVTGDMLQQAAKNGLNREEFITLASIIERETRTDNERPIVAGILLKRLDAGWPLQADATLQYAVASAQCLVPSAKCDWWPQITSDDKKINSPYNTYTNKGLPPTPIANPGLSSIKAAANPESSLYWFYLHDGDGKIHYARTSQEHQENIKNYLQ